MKQELPTYEGIQAIADKSMAMLTPYWDARDNFVRTLISLAAGTVALTATFSKSIASLKPSPIWRYCLTATWASFFVAIISSGLVLWLTKELRLLAFRFFENRPDIKAALAGISTEAPESLKPMDEIREKVFNPLHRNERWAGVGLIVSVISFLIGMILVGILGWG